MFRICVQVFCAVLLMQAIPGAFGSNWWSIVTQDSVFNLKERSKPVDYRCANNGPLSAILSANQVELCKKDRNLLSTAAIGTLRALEECQKLFKERRWNCSVLNEGPYLGRFVEKGTRETAFLNAIISAGIAREVARKCKEQSLDSCHCDFSVKSVLNVDGFTKYGGCGDNDKYGIQLAKSFTDESLVGNQSVISLTTLHNNKVGRELVKNTTVECLCHGVSGSCTVQTCFKKVPDIKQIGAQLLKQYDVAVRTEKKSELEDGGGLKPVDADGGELRSTDLAYLEFSPNFCQRDLYNGIYGTSGRQCYPDRNDHTNCVTLCCGRAPVRKVVDTHDDCCKFVWCCRFECEKCNFHKATKYFCP